MKQHQDWGVSASASPPTGVISPVSSGTSTQTQPLLTTALPGGLGPTWPKQQEKKGLQRERGGILF